MILFVRSFVCLFLGFSGADKQVSFALHRPHVQRKLQLCCCPKMTLETDFTFPRAESSFSL